MAKLDYRIIKSPSKGVKDILQRRMGYLKSEPDFLNEAAAIGLIQGKLIDMIYVADLAEKAAGIHAVDVRGSCPQNMILLALFGDTASVSTAISDIQEKMKSKGSEWL